MNWKTGVLVVVGLLVAGLILGWHIIPRVESILPADGEIQGRQPLEITFSRSMDPDSVEDSLTLSPALDGEFIWDKSIKTLRFTPKSFWPSGELITLWIDRGPRSRLWLPLLRRVTADWPVSPTSLIYLWPADGVSNLYKVNPESGESLAVTDLDRGVLDYSISSDREYVFFSAAAEGGTNGIMQLKLDSGEISQILDCSEGLCTAPRLSADGDWLAYEYISRTPGVLPSIRSLNLQDGTLHNLGEPSEYLENPLWSPSGWLAYYNRTQKGYQFWNPLADEELFLPNETGGDGSWSADGRYFLVTEIVFVSDTLAPRRLQLYDVVEGTSRDLTQGSFLEDLNPSFAPRGLRFAFSRKSLNPQDWTPGRQLWVMDLDSGDAYALTKEVDYQHTSFAWHPDGESLAYVRYNQAALSEPPEIWLIKANGEDPLRLIINGFAPGWIP